MGTVGAALMAYIPLEIGIAFISVFLITVMAVLFGYGRVKTTVDKETLQVGRNRIEGRWISRAEALDGKEAQHAVGPGADHQDFLITRPYISGLVRITLADPADPHPHWLVSSREPEAFAAAVNTISAGQA